MAFFDSLSEVISGKGKEAAEAAKKMAEIANLKGQINGIETEIKKNYRKIGEAYYEAYKDVEVTCEFEEYVQAIRDAQKAVEELKRKVNGLKGEIECKNCGKMIKAGSAFCSVCGAKVEDEFLDEEDTEEDTEKVVIDEEDSEDVIADEVEELEEVVEESAE